MNLYFQTRILYHKYIFDIFTASLLEVSYCNMVAQYFILLSEVRVLMSKLGKGGVHKLRLQEWIDSPGMFCSPQHL